MSRRVRKRPASGDMEKESKEMLATLDNELPLPSDEDEWSDEEREDLFQEVYLVARSLHTTLEKQSCYPLVAPDLKRLFHLLQKLELDAQEREEDTQRLLRDLVRNRARAEASVVTGNSTTLSSSNPVVPSSTGAEETPEATPAAEPVEEDPVARRKRRWHQVVQEIISTEKSYIEQLRLFIECYMEPLEKETGDGKNGDSGGKMLTRAQFQSIFMNVKVLHQTNQVLYKDLVAAYGSEGEESHDCVAMARIFSNMLPYFKAYSSYINSYQTHLSTLIDLKSTNRPFKDLMQQIQNAHPGLLNPNGDLTDLSITPVQRVPRYVLLLQELLSNTPEDDPGRGALQDTLTETRKLAEFINESQRANEKLQAVFLIQSKLEGSPEMPNLMEPHRFYVTEGSILTLTDRVHRRHIFVFNDILVVAKRRFWALKGMSQSSNSINGSDSNINSLVGAARDAAASIASESMTFECSIPLREASIRDDTDVPFSFRIVYHKGTKFLTLVGESEEDKAHWMRLLTNTIAECWHLSAESGLASPKKDDDTGRGSVPPPAAGSFSKQGYLNKMEGAFLHSWKNRWIQITSLGILYSFASHTDPVPLRSYPLNEFALSRMYVTENFTRYCVELNQVEGKRQIILSAPSKAILQEWVLALKRFINIEKSTALQKTPRRGSSASTRIRTKTSTPSTPSQRDSTDGPILPLPEPDSSEMHLELPAPLPPTSASGAPAHSMPSYKTRAVMREAQQAMHQQQQQQQQQRTIASGHLPGVGLKIDSQRFLSRRQQTDSGELSSSTSSAAAAKTVAEPSPAPSPSPSPSPSAIRMEESSSTSQNRTRKKKTKRPRSRSGKSTGDDDSAPSKDKKEDKEDSSEGETQTREDSRPEGAPPSLSESPASAPSPASAKAVPAVVAAFTKKFNLPQPERPLEYFPLPGNCFIYLTKTHLCIESQGKPTYRAIHYSQIKALRKQKAGLLGKGTSGRIELFDGTGVDIAGMTRRRETFESIAKRADDMRPVNEPKVSVLRD